MGTVHCICRVELPQHSTSKCFVTELGVRLVELHFTASRSRWPALVVVGSLGTDTGWPHSGLGCREGVGSSPPVLATELLPAPGSCGAGSEHRSPRAAATATAPPPPPRRAARHAPALDSSSGRRCSPPTAATTSMAAAGDGSRGGERTGRSCLPRCWALLCTSSEARPCQPRAPPAHRCRRYWRVTLPGDGQSFALIYSIENPLGNLPHSGVGAQASRCRWPQGGGAFLGAPGGLALQSYFEGGSESCGGVEGGCAALRRGAGSKGRALGGWLAPHGGARPSC